MTRESRKIVDPSEAEANEKHQSPGCAYRNAGGARAGRGACVNALPHLSVARLARPAL